LKELWHKLWKVQTEGYLVLADECEDRANLPARLVNQIDKMRERQIISPHVTADLESSATGQKRAVICPDLLSEGEAPIAAGGSIQDWHKSGRTTKLLDF